MGKWILYFGTKVGIWCPRLWDCWLILGSQRLWHFHPRFSNHMGLCDLFRHHFVLTWRWNYKPSNAECWYVDYLTCTKQSSKHTFIRLLMFSLKLLNSISAFTNKTLPITEVVVSLKTCKLQQKFSCTYSQFLARALTIAFIVMCLFPGSMKKSRVFHHLHR